MSTITLNLPKPFRPWMAWVVSGIAIFLMATVLVTRNNRSAPIASERAPILTARQSSVAGVFQQAKSGEINRSIRTTNCFTCSLELTVSSPSQTAEQVRLLAEKLEGYLENAESGGQASTQASITIRIPATQLESAKAEIRKLAVRIEARNLTPLTLPNNTLTCRRACAI
jgi:hypothetical protein